MTTTAVATEARDLCDYLWREYSIWQIHEVDRKNRLFQIGLELKVATRCNDAGLVGELRDELLDIAARVEARFRSRSLEKILAGAGGVPLTLE